MPILLTGLLHTETYTFTPNDGSPDIHILSGRLRTWLHTHAKDKLVDLYFPEEHSIQEIVVMHGLEEDRIQSMTAEEASEPVIVGLYLNGVSILIDGGHRRHYWASRGVHVLRGWAVPEEVWREFCFDPETMPGWHHLDGSLLPQRRK